MVATHMGACNTEEYFEKWIKYLKLKKLKWQKFKMVATHMGDPNMGVSKHEGHPNIQGASKCMGEYGHSLSVTKHAFFVLFKIRLLFRF